MVLSDIKMSIRRTERKKSEFYEIFLFFLAFFLLENVGIFFVVIQSREKVLSDIKMPFAILRGKICGFYKMFPFFLVSFLRKRRYPIFD